MYAIAAKATFFKPAKFPETGNSAKNGKPGSVGKSTLPGVEVAGFPFGPQFAIVVHLRYSLAELLCSLELHPPSSATGGGGFRSPRPFGPEPKIQSVFPVLAASFPEIP